MTQNKTNENIIKKIEKEIYKTYQSKRETSQLIDDVYYNSNFRDFFEFLLKHSRYRRLFSLQPGILFNPIFGLPFPFFHATSFTNNPQSKQDIGNSYMLYQYIRRKFEPFDDPLLVFQKYLGEDPSNFQIFRKDLWDLLHHHIHKEEGKPALLTRREYEEKSKQSAILFTKALAKNERNQIRIPSLLEYFHLYTEQRVSKLLQQSRLSLVEYTKVLDALLLFQLIHTEHVLTICYDCYHVGGSPWESTRPIKPSLIQLPCPNCGDPMDYSAIYSLHPTLKEILFSRDGFSLVFLGWGLKRCSIPFITQAYSKESENDILILNQILTEVKQFKLEKDEIAIASELKSSLTQVRNHIDQYRSEKNIIKKYLLRNETEGYEQILKKLKSGFAKFQTYIDQSRKEKRNITKGFLLWNRTEGYETILKQLKRESPHLFAKYEPEVVSIENVERIWNYCSKITRSDQCNPQEGD